MDSAVVAEATSRAGRRTKPQALYLVFGGRLRDPESGEFEAFAAFDIRGIFPSYAEALAAWRGASQASVDDAYIRYLIIRLR